MDFYLTAWPQMANFGQNSTKCDLGHSNTLWQHVEFLKSQTFIGRKPKSRFLETIGLRSHKRNLARTAWLQMANFGQNWTKSDLGHSNTLWQHVEFMKSPSFIGRKPKSRFLKTIGFRSQTKLGSNCMASDGQFWPKLDQLWFGQLQLSWATCRIFKKYKFHR